MTTVLLLAVGLAVLYDVCWLEPRRWTRPIRETRWDDETGYPRECVAEGLGMRGAPEFVEERKPSPVVPVGTLDPSAQRALAEITRESLA